mgnify:CR=1 FL=1
MARRKSSKEARVERITWFLLVFIFAILSIIPEGDIPNWTVPASGAIVLLGSGLYQNMQRWHVSPLTWIAGTLMMVLALINFYVSPEQDFLGFTLLTFAAVIGMGILTGET